MSRPPWGWLALFPLQEGKGSGGRGGASWSEPLHAGMKTMTHPYLKKEEKKDPQTCSFSLMSIKEPVPKSLRKAQLYVCEGSQSSSSS